MKKNLVVLIWATIGLFSCKQTNIENTNSVKNSQNKKTLTNYDDKDIYSKYEYTNSMGKRLIIQNSLPKGGQVYIGSNGEKYFYAIFWTRIINETDNPLELKIEFPLASYELPSAPGADFRLFFPADTMTNDKKPLYDYGLTGLKSFVDDAFFKPSFLKRIISPEKSCSFYVVTLSKQGVNGPVRTEFFLKGQNVYYSINKNEIHCGKINLKNLNLQK